MSSIVVEYAPADVAETRHYKISMKVPPKWLLPEKGTKVKKILDAFAKSYGAKFGAGALGTEEMSLMDPKSRRVVGAGDSVIDLVASKASTFRVVAVAGKAAPEAERSEPEPAPAPAPAPAAASVAPDPPNRTGRYRTGVRRFQDDQPPVSEHVKKPKTKIYTYGVIGAKGTPYHAGPWDEASLCPNPPRCHKGTIFEGLVDEQFPGRIRVVREALGVHDGYWICRIYEGKETVTLLDKGTALRAGRPYVPPAPYVKPGERPEPPPKREVDPAVSAAWDNYLKNGLDDAGGGLPTNPSATAPSFDDAPAGAAAPRKDNPIERAKERMAHRAAAAGDDRDEDRE